MCRRERVQVHGLAANHLGIIPVRGQGTLSIWATRVVRLGREAALTWAFIVRLYDRVSNEAECVEAARPP